MTLPDKRKLQWQCRRGMLELDVILIPFLDQHYEGLSEQEKNAFVALLEQPDPDLFNWLMGHGKSDNERVQRIIDRIRSQTGCGRQ